MDKIYILTEKEACELRAYLNSINHSMAVITQNKDNQDCISEFKKIDDNLEKALKLTQL